MRAVWEVLVLCVRMSWPYLLILLWWVLILMDREGML
jgi:hypothetical protein